jgi:hypothetical protein
MTSREPEPASAAAVPARPGPARARPPMTKSGGSPQPTTCTSATSAATWRSYGPVDPDMLASLTGRDLPAILRALPNST